MDFSKFRASGDLSDIVVVVDGHESHLHRFPLYAKSDYFCTLARGPSVPQSPVFNKSRVELTEFPGGQAVFSLVADFCYNMASKVSKDNVVQLRCAAQFLQMSGPGNLADAADKFLQDTLASAKLSRSSSTPMNLLLHCATVGQLAAASGVVDTCTDALVDTWLRSPSKFSPANPAGGSGAPQGSAFTLQGSAFTPTKPSLPAPSVLNAGVGGGGEVTDEATLSSLCQLPEDWLANLLKKALDRGVRQSLLADMAVRYVSHAIDMDKTEGRSNGNGTVRGGIASVNGHSTPINDYDAAVNGTPVDIAQNIEDFDKDIDSTRAEVEVVSIVRNLSPVPTGRKVDLGVLLDTVLTTLPEDAYNLPSLTMEWLTKVLRIATARGCHCRRFLVKIAADMLARLQAEDLCLVSPSVLHDIVLEAKTDESQAERACTLVDTYLGEMAKKGVLTAETFRLLANATPADARRNHDNLYEVLEYVLKNEKESLSSEQREELLSTINLDLVTEETLQRALDSDLVSPEPVARAALKLCAGLRSELESVKYIAQMQEEELHKYQSRTSPQPSPRAPTLPPAKIDSDSGFSDNCHDTKTSSDSVSDPVRAAQSVLSSARTKLAMPLYTGHRPYLPSSSHSHPSSAYAGTGLGVEHDISLQEELDYRFDRSSFRSLEPRVSRSRHMPGFGSHSGSSSSSSSHHRSTYFPYSQRY